MKNKIDYDKYHRQLGLLITDSLQNPMPNQRFWKYFKQSYISHETVYDLMTQPLLEKYLPLGSSYTFDVNRAIWFAKRFRSNQAILTSVTMKTSDIDAIWLERDEQEVFMLPSIVRKKAIKIVDNYALNCG